MRGSAFRTRASEVARICTCGLQAAKRGKAARKCSRVDGDSASTARSASFSIHNGRRRRRPLSYFPRRGACRPALFMIDAPAQHGVKARVAPLLFVNVCRGFPRPRTKARPTIISRVGSLRWMRNIWRAIHIATCSPWIYANTEMQNPFYISAHANNEERSQITLTGCRPTKACTRRGRDLRTFGDKRSRLPLCSGSEIDGCDGGLCSPLSDDNTARMSTRRPMESCTSRPL